MQSNVYLQELVADALAARGLPGTVKIFPSKPLAVRHETGERAQFIVDYHGAGEARITVDEWQISSGTKGARIADALADLIERTIQRRLAA